MSEKAPVHLRKIQYLGYNAWGFIFALEFG
jgi:hypothetical protein